MPRYRCQGSDLAFPCVKFITQSQWWRVGISHGFFLSFWGTFLDQFLWSVCYVIVINLVMLILYRHHFGDPDSHFPLFSSLYNQVQSDVVKLYDRWLSLFQISKLLNKASPGLSYVIANTIEKISINKATLALRSLLADPGEGGQCAKGHIPNSAAPDLYLRGQKHPMMRRLFIGINHIRHISARSRRDFSSTESWPQIGIPLRRFPELMDGSRKQTPEKSPQKTGKNYTRLWLKMFMSNTIW